MSVTIGAAREEGGCVAEHSGDQLRAKDQNGVDEPRNSADESIASAPCSRQNDR
jgi:hypothetical protein